MNKDDILKDFDTLAEAKRKGAVNLKLCLGFALVVVVLVLAWGLVVNFTALDKVVVVERSGEYLKTHAEDSEALFLALVKKTCAEATGYANSFDRLNLKKNQAHAAFYVNKNDLNAVFSKYYNDKAYFDAVQNGAVYKCEIDSIQTIAGDNEPYKVAFTSTLTIYGVSGQKLRFLIRTKGEIVRTTPQFPENKGNTIEAIVSGDQKITNGSVIKLVTLQEMQLPGGMVINKGTAVFGVVKLAQDRINITVESVRIGNSIYEMQKTVYDRDGLPGIYVPLNIKAEATKEAADEVVSDMNVTSYGTDVLSTGVNAVSNAAKSVFRKKNNQVVVTVKSNYKLYLK